MASLSAERLGTASPDFLEQRRRAVIESSDRMGLDSVVPRRIESPDEGTEHWQLELRFLAAGWRRRQAAAASVPAAVTAANLRITQGDLRDPGVRVQSVARGEGVTLVARVLRDPPTAALATSDSPPVYTLELVDLPQVDRFFRRARFIFREGMTPPAQPAARPASPAPREIPDIDYLAKDYDSFRRLMLERLNALVPGWHDTHAADLGVTVVELLAHAADYLSYYQDAVATEAYIATARRRISVRRHARLIDYRLHEGCNARCWVQLKVERRRPEEAAGGDGQGAAQSAGLPAEAGVFELPAGIEVLTYSGRLPSVLEEGSREHQKALLGRPLIFHTLEARTLHPEHNKIEIYTWGAESFELPAGSTSAALLGHLELAPGEVLVFERRADPEAGGAEAVDPRQRQAVRLCRPPRQSTDRSALGDGESVPITEIEWFAEDALALDFPVAKRRGSRVLHRLSVVRGNLVLADHGQARHELLEPVPGEGIYRPRLSHRGLTHRVGYEPEKARLEPASEGLCQDPRQALPDLVLYPFEPGELGKQGDSAAAEESQRSSRPRWYPRYDLLASGRNARDFVAEVDDDGFACLRFGDDQNGRRPAPGTVFQAVYRVGLGPEGNLGAYSLRHAVIPAALLEESRRRGLRLVELKNHLAGGGGLEREPMEKARKLAPEALRSRRSRLSCVIDADFVEIAERHPEVQRAAVSQRWGGSWDVVQLFVQRSAGRPVDELFLARLQRFMKPYLVVGCELEILPPRHVPLDLRLRVWPNEMVEHEVLEQKLHDRLAAGEVKLLHPGYFTFGKNVYLSEVVAEMMALPEVVDVAVEVFQRWGQPARGELEAGEITIEPLEIAQLDNDPGAPHRGILQVTLEAAP